MGLYFYNYISRHGGDSLFYWQLPSYFDSDLPTWISAYRYGDHFLQSLNSPWVWGGVGYMGGTFLYNFLSMLGIGLIYEKVYDSFGGSEVPGWLLALCALLVCLSPGLHFWTGGVSKESLLVLALALVFRYFEAVDAKSLLLVFLGFFLALHTRLVVGIILAIPCFLPVFSCTSVSRRLRLIVSGIAGLMLLQGFIFLRFALFGEDDVSIGAIREVSEQQLEFLGGFGAASQIDFSGMGFFGRLSTILFRPFPWETADIHSLVYSLENTFLVFVLVAGGIVLVLLESRPPRTALAFFAISLAMVIIYTFTLNNYGIVYRMKSIFSPFLSLPFIWAICREIADRGKFSA
ncbi:hypothetical protein J0A67_04955 [Algoriphagus aestuariicola]|uniref:EpsG family protein n=1 Tax=Algoriphagus aestuariicola TaxID=1852016 RepID=A0ABS3BMF4_9BACT|nr:hypothetical protein [Algoriphagus aestuariicola]MBN7800197.1 hypothetical protein [Algoriphagus aestuariicola]